MRQRRHAEALAMRVPLLLLLLAVAGCAGEIARVAPAARPALAGLDQTYYSANPAPGNCVATCVRPGAEPGVVGWLISLGTPKICHSTCVDYDGHLVYLPPSTPGAGAVISSMAGPFADLAGRLAPVIAVPP